MKSVITTLGLLAAFSWGCGAYIPRMIHGRPKGGLVGSPGNKHRGLNVAALTLPPDEWFEQKLDHFNGASTKYWKQRYFTNATFFKPGGPLFVQIGGEGTADPIWMVEGAWIEYAQKYNAYCVQLEHRFYGQSHPTINMSVDNLKYLSSEQALADLAAFITYLKALLNNPKVITFGGSYPGSLSAWFRLKYPHLVDGAVASSAPLLAVVNFKEDLRPPPVCYPHSKKNSCCNNKRCYVNIKRCKIVYNVNSKRCKIVYNVNNKRCKIVYNVNNKKRKNDNNNNNWNFSSTTIVSNKKNLLNAIKSNKNHF